MRGDQGLDPGVGILVAQGEDEVQTLVDRLERKIGWRCRGVKHDRCFPASLRPQGISQVAQEPAALALKQFAADLLAGNRPGSVHQIVTIDEPAHETMPRLQAGTLIPTLLEM